MIVNVKGHGAISFPDTMTDGEIRKVLTQFEPKKDDSVEKLIQSIDKMLKKQKPQVIETQKLVEVEKQVIVKEPRVIEVEKVIEGKSSPVSWHFTIERDDSGITDIYAEPMDE